MTPQESVRFLAYRRGLFLEALKDLNQRSSGATYKDLKPRAAAASRATRDDTETTYKDWKRGPRWETAPGGFLVPCGPVPTRLPNEG